MLKLISGGFLRFFLVLIYFNACEPPKSFLIFPINIISKKNLKKPRAIIICLQGSNSGAHLNYDQIILPNDHLKVNLGSGHAIHASLNDCIAVSYERIGYGERREKQIKTKTPRWRRNLLKVNEENVKTGTYCIIMIMHLF